MKFTYALFDDSSLKINFEFVQFLQEASPLPMNSFPP